MEPIKLENITPETLYDISEEWERVRVAELLRDDIVELGKELAEREYQLEISDLRCRVKAVSLYHHYGMEKREIAKLFDVPVRRVTKWLK